MENEILTRRGLIILLVSVTVVIFIGLVWLIARLQPWVLLGVQGSTATPQVQIMANCTYPVAYWKTHPELFPSQIIIGGTTYKEKELEALLTDNHQDIGQQLKAQLAATFLNNLSGADQSEIEQTVFDAYGWLIQHPTGSQISNEELEVGRHLFDLMEAYNTGSAGVPPCEAVTTAAKTATSTGISNLQSGTNTVIGSPSMTGTLVVTSLTPKYTPTHTRTTTPSLTPTRTVLASPTNTLPPQAPSPTRTNAPTFTHTPQPTFTATTPPTYTASPTLPPTDTPEPTLPPTDTPNPTLPAANKP
jgi:hypothetical protein